MSFSKAFFLTWRHFKFSDPIAPGALTFRLQLSGQSYLCLFFIFIFMHFKVVSSLECFQTDATQAYNLLVLPKFISGLVSPVWVCMWVCVTVCVWAHIYMCTLTHTHTHSYTQISMSSHWHCQSLFISYLITKQCNMQSLRTASGHLPIMHYLIFQSFIFSSQSIERNVCQEHTFQNYNSWYYCNVKAKQYNWLNRKRDKPVTAPVIH